MPPKLTKEQEADVKARTEAFRADFIQLVEKHQIDFYAYPQTSPTPTGGFEIVAVMTMFDKKYLPVPSPIQATDKTILKK